MAYLFHVFVIMHRNLDSHVDHSFGELFIIKTKIYKQLQLIFHFLKYFRNLKHLGHCYVDSRKYIL